MIPEETPGPRMETDFVFAVEKVRPLPCAGSRPDGSCSMLGSVFAGSKVDCTPIVLLYHPLSIEECGKPPRIPSRTHIQVLGCWLCNARQLG